MTAGQTASRAALTRPFLKWPGGKTRLVERIRTQLPPGARLVEPFVGSGALFINTAYPQAQLADSNDHLVLVFQALREQGEDFIAACRRLFQPRYNTPEIYYQRRDAFNRGGNPNEQARLFVYLNRHGYNGLCRYNASGGFNVPFGRYKKPYFPEAEMRLFHQRLQGAEILRQDFRMTLGGARPGDVVYCDPPYVPLTATANFTAYSEGGFTLQDQRDLADCARELARRGIPVLISNHDTPLTRSLYAGAEIDTFDVQRCISCDGDKRGVAAEVLALFRPGPGRTALTGQTQPA